MRRQHYTTKNSRVGYKCCNYCNKHLLAQEACKCSITLTFRGHPDVVRRAIYQVTEMLDLIEIDDDYKGGVDTEEVTIVAVFKNIETGGES